MNKIQQNKSFLLPIVIFPIIFVLLSVTLLTLYNINSLNYHANKKIQDKKKEYISAQKNNIIKKVNFANNSIKFQIKQMENKLKKSLKERINIALKTANYIYNQYKGKLSDKDIKKKIINHLNAIRYESDGGYYFIYEYDTNIMIGHIMPKFIGKNMTGLLDIKGQNLIDIQTKALSKSNIGFSKIYFNKPNDPNNEYPKITCVGKFEPLNLVIGTGEYLDIIKKEVQNQILTRFKAFKKDNKSYLFIYELNNINGGVDFATMILNQNRPDLIGKKISDDYKDAKGKKFRKEFLNKIRKNGKGYVKYWYKKPNSQGIHPKLSYFYLQKDWNWIIASGFYFDDLTQDIEAIKTDIQSDIDKTIKSSITVAVILLLITSIISYLISNRLNKVINNYIDQLSSSEHKLKKAQNIAKIGSWKHTISDNTLVWSDEVYNIFEVSKDDKITTYRKFLSIIHPDDKAYVSIEYNKSIQNQTPYDIKHRLLMDDGKIKYVREKCDIICDEQNQPIYTLGTVQDITNEVLKQKELDQKEQLLFEQSKMASMGEMIGNIAHQWRQPLSVISTAATGMQLKIEYNIFNEKEALKDLDKLEQSCQYLSHTIDDFQNFLKPATNNEIFNIKDIINKQMDMFGSSFITSNIEFILDIKDVNIYGNKNELLQVVINILNNAKDALIEKDIENKYIFIKLKKQNNNAILTIRDNAGGIPKDILPKIFDAYFTTKHKNQGTGLGLYMSYQIIKNKFKGEITVNNNKYKYLNNQYTGANFIINLECQKL